MSYKTMNTTTVSDAINQAETNFKTKSKLLNLELWLHDPDYSILYLIEELNTAAHLLRELATDDKETVGDLFILKKMTEAELKQNSEFANLPFYDESDERCDSLHRPQDSEYQGTIVEPENEVQFWDAMNDPQLVPKGAVRYGTDDVRAVFWLKRS